MTACSCADSLGCQVREAIGETWPRPLAGNWTLKARPPKRASCVFPMFFSELYYLMSTLYCSATTRERRAKIARR